MRLLYVIDSLGFGGAETLLLSLVDKAIAQGHDVHVAYFTHGPLAATVQARAASVTRLGNRGLKDPRVLLRAISLMRALRPDVVHTHLTKSDLVGQCAALLCRVPVRVLTLHNTDPWRRNPVLGAVYRMVTCGVHHAIAVSEEVARFTLQTRGIARKKLVVIRNGVDVARFRPAAQPRPAGPFRAAVIGRLQPQKDHATFLAALKILRGSLADARFDIVGDGPLLPDLRAMADALGLAQSVRFTGPLQDIPQVLGALDAVILSSAWEGLPMVMLEAMACAKPVIATAVGEIPRVIEDGENGVLVPPRDPAALAKAIKRVARDPALAARLGQNAHQTVLSGYSDAAMFARIFALYGAPRDTRALA